MYTPLGNEVFSDIAGIPLSDAGAPEPSITADEHEIKLTYTTDEAAKATVTFRHALIHIFGAPNNETFTTHPLYGLGLQPYSTVEVMQSGWIAELAAADVAHPRHNPERFKQFHHCIFAFHDSTFECIAQEILLSND